MTLLPMSLWILLIKTAPSPDAVEPGRTPARSGGSQPAHVHIPPLSPDDLQSILRPLVQQQPLLATALCQNAMARCAAGAASGDNLQVVVQAVEQLHLQAAEALAIAPQPEEACRQLRWLHGMQPLCPLYEGLFRNLLRSLAENQHLALYESVLASSRNNADPDAIPLLHVLEGVHDALLMEQYPNGIRDRLVAGAWQGAMDSTEMSRPGASPSPPPKDPHHAATDTTGGNLPDPILCHLARITGQDPVCEAASAAVSAAMAREWHTTNNVLAYYSQLRHLVAVIAWAADAKATPVDQLEGRKGAFANLLQGSILAQASSSFASILQNVCARCAFILTVAEQVGGTCPPCLVPQSHMCAFLLQAGQAFLPGCCFLCGLRCPFTTFSSTKLHDWLL